MIRRRIVVFGGLLLALSALAIGCAEEPKTPAKGAAAESAEAQEIREAMAELSEADRKLAEAQGVCPVGDGPLGAMGKPYKMTVKGRDVFLCCDGCKEVVEKDPDAILAKLDEKKAEAK